MSVILARISVGFVLTATVASPSFAQRLEPIGASSRMLTAGSNSTQVAPQISERPISSWRGAVGGVLGGGAGMFAGLLAGDALAHPCAGEDCGLKSALVGMALGEAVGLAVGTHYGSRGHANVALTALTSTAVGVAGALAAASFERAAPGILLGIPVVQFAVLLATER